MYRYVKITTYMEMDDTCILALHYATITNSLSYQGIPKKQAKRVKMCSRINRSVENRVFVAISLE